MHPRIPLAFLAARAHCCPPGHPGPSPQSCSPAGLPEACTDAWGCSSQVQDPAFAFVEPHQVPLCPTFQPVKVTLNGSTAFWCIFHGNYTKLILSNNAVLAAEFKTVKFHRTLQNPTKIKLDFLYSYRVAQSGTSSHTDGFMQIWGEDLWRQQACRSVVVFCFPFLAIVLP